MRAASGSWRCVPAVVACAVLLAAGAAAAAAAGSGNAVSARLDAQATTAPKLPAALRPAMTISPNWSGYVATAPPGSRLAYTSVTGTWTVPTAVCTRGNRGTYSTIWVGLGGYTQTRQEEVGTDANCSASGKPSYYAWFELVPYLSFPTTINDAVSAGDTITGLVSILNPKLVELRLRNQTRGWTFTRKINWALNDTTTADWVIEAPAICKQQVCSEASLSDFGSATMRDISATARGKRGTLADPAWKVIPIRLVPSKLTVPVISPTAISAGHRGQQGQAKSPAGATPGPVSADGRRFSWRWVKVATKGV